MWNKIPSIKLLRERDADDDAGDRSISSKAKPRRLARRNVPPCRFDENVPFRSGIRGTIPENIGEKLHLAKCISVLILLLEFMDYLNRT